MFCLRFMYAGSLGCSVDVCKSCISFVKISLARLTARSSSVENSGRVNARGSCGLMCSWIVWNWFACFCMDLMLLCFAARMNPMVWFSCYCSSGSLLLLLWSLSLLLC